MKRKCEDGRFQSYLALGRPSWLHDRIARETIRSDFWVFITLGVKVLFFVWCSHRFWLIINSDAKKEWKENARKVERERRVSLETLSLSIKWVHFLYSQTEPFRCLLLLHQPSRSTMSFWASEDSTLAAASSASSTKNSSEGTSAPSKTTRSSRAAGRFRRS